MPASAFEVARATLCLRGCSGWPSRSSSQEAVRSGISVKLTLRLMHCGGWCSGLPNVRSRFLWILLDQQRDRTGDDC